MLVEQLANNQYIIQNGDQLIFQSYKTIIAIKENGVITLDKDSWDYSRTTSKYRSYFLGEKTKETRKKIESGVYKLEKLN